jgi:NADH-quinone oxidoreductase subunit C
MTLKAEKLRTALQETLGDCIEELTLALGEVTVVVDKGNYLRAMRALRESAGLQFEELIDLCGVDYSGYGEGTWRGARFAVVSHLLSLTHNWRVRVRVFVPEEEPALVPSVTDIWPSANWYEREAFDLFGILFDGHPDLRRILTDYGFVGHPFRKDFPVSGYVEMRYDEQEKRIVYQPVTVEPRELTRRVIREEDYGRR